jgi:hypothetical protein
MPEGQPMYEMWEEKWTAKQCPKCLSKIAVSHGWIFSEPLGGVRHQDNKPKPTGEIFCHEDGTQCSTITPSMPDDINNEVALQATPIRRSLMEKGWHVGPIRWMKEEDRTLKFMIKPPGSEVIFVECQEIQLAQKLQQYLSSN